MRDRSLLAASQQGQVAAGQRGWEHAADAGVNGGLDDVCHRMPAGMSVMLQHLRYFQMFQTVMRTGNLT
jgi:hypothetical protein